MRGRAAGGAGRGGGVASNAAVYAIMVGLSGHSLVQPRGPFSTGSVASKAPLLDRTRPCGGSPLLCLVALLGESHQRSAQCFSSLRPGSREVACIPHHPAGHPAWLTSVHEPEPVRFGDMAQYVKQILADAFGRVREP